MYKGAIGVGLVFLVLAAGIYLYIHDACPEGLLSAWYNPTCASQDEILAVSVSLGVIGGIVSVAGLVLGSAERKPLPILPPSTPEEESDSALKLLRERFARGELSEEEYERMRKKLQEE